MKGKHLTEALVFHMPAGHLPDGSVRTKANEIRGDPQHVGEMGEGLVGQFDKGFLEDGVSFPDKAAVAFEIPGEMFAHLFFHLELVAGVFEGLSVVPGDPIKRMAGDNADIVGGFFSGEGKEFIQQERSGQDRGAGVVGKALVAKNRSPTPGLLESFEECDIVSACLQTDGRGESAEAGADHEGGGASRCDQGRRGV